MGRHLAQAAVDRGHYVRGLELSSAAAAKLTSSGYEILEGSITEPATAANFCEDLDAVVHLAAMMREDGEWEVFREINVDGTTVMAEAAKNAGVSGFIHVSSVMVYGYDFPPSVDEQGPLCGENNPYCQTKIESEEAIRPFHDEDGLRVTVVRPGDVYGPGSLPWVIRPLDLMKKRLFILPDGGRGIMNPIHVSDLVTAYLDILEQEAYGETYNLTDGCPLSFIEYFSRLAALAGRRPPMCLPKSLLQLLFLVIPKSLATRSAIDIVSRNNGYSIEKARKDFGFEPKVSLEQGLKDLKVWLETVDISALAKG